MPEEGRYDDIESVIAEARSLPDFPLKAQVIRCLEIRNINDYGRALELLAEASTSPGGGAVDVARLDSLATRIRLLEASERVGE